MISDSLSLKSRKSPRTRSVHKPNAHWSDKQKIETVQTYLMLNGNLALTARTLSMPEHTLRTWKVTDWWKELVEEFRKEEQLILSNKLKKIAEKSLDLMEERLDKGDFIYDQKTGALKRKPVTLSDATKAATAMIQTKEKLQERENFSVAAEHIEQKLSKLAEAFSKLSKGETLKTEAEDLEYVEIVEEDEDALPEERETQLQAGV